MVHTCRCRLLAAVLRYVLALRPINLLHKIYVGTCRLVGYETKFSDLLVLVIVDLLRSFWLLYEFQPGLFSRLLYHCMYVETWSLSKLHRTVQFLSLDKYIFNFNKQMGFQALFCRQRVLFSRWLESDGDDSQFYQYLGYFLTHLHNM